ncbi:hypothetical protein Cgig2_007488 [Carnegiea gigantea]|uniref:Reverse transcriptase domain-containing protein n=1 Tax=Carnegiea gigantea TaxID=171969 RepID=A0A9Q1GKE2_9CARY|nr:hypothetical protein Cgig2_007488 [Carnegiea gigantea]
MVHLIFADDLIVFSAAEENTIQHLLNAFAKFSRSTGLEDNKHKSQVMVGGCTERQAQQIKALTGFKGAYLEVPITANKLSRIECRILVENFTQRIKTWAARSASYVGRVALINSGLKRLIKRCPMTHERTHGSPREKGVQKKDILWIKWVQERYLVRKSWWNYYPKKDVCWNWGKLCKVKEIFK